MQDVSDRKCHCKDWPVVLYSDHMHLDQTDLHKQMFIFIIMNIIFLHFFFLQVTIG